MKRIVTEGLIAGAFGGRAGAGGTAGASESHVGRSRMRRDYPGAGAAGGIAARCWRNGDEDRRAVVS